MREQNALPYEARNKAYPLAKDTIDNGEAGRAAKGTNPSPSSFLALEGKRPPRIIGGSCEEVSMRGFS